MNWNTTPGQLGIRAKRMVNAICSSSGMLSADALIYTGKALIVGIKVLTDGTNDANLKVYDGTSGAGTQVDEWDVTGSENYGGCMFPAPLGMTTGVYCDITGTGARYVVFYVPL